MNASTDSPFAAENLDLHSEKLPVVALLSSPEYPADGVGLDSFSDDVMPSKNCLNCSGENTRFVILPSTGAEVAAISLLLFLRL